MTSAGSIAIDLTLNDKAFNKSVQSATKTADSAFTKSANNATRAFTKSANASTSAFSKSAMNTEKAYSSSFGKIGKIIASAFAVGAVVNFSKTCIQAASDAQAAWTGLNSIVKGTGNDFGVAQKFLSEYTKDGLVAIGDAATAYKNLLARGYDTTQIENVMTALKDSAAFGRQSSYTLSQAVVSATEGLKNENSILVDNAGVTKNVAKMWDDYAASIGTTANNLTQQQKIQAEVNGILTETKFQVGDAATYTSTFAGKVAQLKASFTAMKTAVGKVVAPIVGLFIPAITSAVNAVTSLFNKLAKFLSMFGLEFPDVVEKTAESTGAAARSIGSIGDSADATAGDLARTGTAAEKAAKKINKAFSSVDEINVIRTSTESSSGSSGSGGSSGSAGSGSSSGGSGISEAVQAVDTGNGAIDKAINKINELKNAFSDGFKIGWGGNSFEELINDLKSIKGHVLDIFTDPEVTGAAGRWANTVLLALGQVVGSVASIGTSIATLLVGSIESYLNKNKNRIKKYIVNMFDITGETAKITGKLSVALANIAKVFKGQKAQNIGGNIIAMFANPFMSVTELAAKLGRDIVDLIATPIIENQETIKVALENTFAPLEEVTATVSEALTFIGDKFNQVYDDHLKPFFDDLKTGISDTFGKLLNVYNEHVAPFLSNVATMFNDTWENHLKPFFDKVGDVIGKVIDVIKVLWNNWLKPIVDWIIQNVVPVIVPILENVYKTFKIIFDRIVDTLKNFMQMIGGVIDFIVGIFTGDWKRAWEGIKSIFTGLWDNIKGHFKAVWDFLKQLVSNKVQEVKSVITVAFNYIKDYFSSIWTKIKDTVKSVWDGIKSLISGAIDGIKTGISKALDGIKSTWSKIWNGVKDVTSSIFNGIWNVIKKVINSILSGIEAMANGVVSGINLMIRALNKLHFEIPDWVPALGGKSFGFDLNEVSKISIPRLYEGAYFQRNNPTLAVVGDNRTEGEFVAPEGKLKQSVKEAIQELGFNNNENLQFDFTFRMIGDDGRTIIKKINDVTIQDGKVTLLV